MRRKVWLVVILAFVVLSAWLGYKGRQNSPYRQVQQELARLQQLGEPTKISDLLPPVPANQDGTALYKLAIAQLEAAQRKLPRQVWDSIYEFISRQPTKPINLADVQKALQEANPALQTLRKALNYPHMRMTEWDIENPIDIAFPHFAKFREFARLLVAKGKWRKGQGDVDGAVESHLTVLKLVRRMGDEPSLIGFLVQDAIFFLTVGGLQQLLSDADPSPKSYQALLSELMAWDIDRDFVRVIQFERVFTIVTCGWMDMKASRKTLNELSNTGGSNLPQVNLAIWLKGKGDLIARNELKLLKRYEALLKLAREGVPYDWEKLKQLEERWEREVNRPVRGLNLGNVQLVWDENFVAKILMPTYSTIFSRAASSHALQRLTQVAIALRLYRREHGHYPETLHELVPRYLSSVPLDPFDGKPLRYKRLKQGFKVWSVGPDLEDDGGVEGKPRWVKGDIVWEALR